MSGMSKKQRKKGKKLPIAVGRLGAERWVAVRFRQGAFAYKDKRLKTRAEAKRQSQIDRVVDKGVDPATDGLSGFAGSDEQQALDEMRNAGAQTAARSDIAS